jgi:DNA-binding transcriptional LysR family regulator
MCVLSRFLPQYTERFPNVHVELSEALGPEQKTLLECGEVHFGIRLEQGGPRFDSRVLPPAEALAAGATSIERGQAGLIDIGGLATYPLLLLDLGIPSAGWSTQLAASQTSSQIFCSRVLHRIGCLLCGGMGRLPHLTQPPPSEQTATICKLSG